MGNKEISSNNFCPKAVLNNTGKLLKFIYFWEKLF